MSWVCGMGMGRGWVSVVGVWGVWGKLMVGMLQLQSPLALCYYAVNTYFSLTLIPI